MTTPAGRPDRGRDHYSYTHYASTEVAEGFDALRFGGVVGQYLQREQARLLAEAIAPVAGRTVADVGTGTGRAAIGLAALDARVVGLDASAEMLAVARQRAGTVGVSVPVSVADAHALPLADRSVDVTVCLRVLMHAVDWERCLGELCRIAKWRVVVDFPSSSSAARIESAVRRLRQKRGHAVEAYRVFDEATVTRALARHGFRVVRVRKEFVLPIALHKNLGAFGLTRRVESLMRATGLLRLLGSPVTIVAER